MNTVFSAFFDDFTFITCDYDSPTREGVVATDRPFVEVSINGCDYLVDALTKRIFRSDLFREKYHLKEKNSISKRDFNSEQVELYFEQTTEHVGYATFILLVSDFIFANPSMAEMLYEFDKSKEYFPEEFDEAEKLKADIMSGDIMKQFLKK